MDPLSVSAGIVGITEQLYKIQKAFSSKNVGARTVVQDTTGDLSVYIDILNEMSSEVTNFRGNLPPSAHSCLKLCYERASRVVSLMSKEAGVMSNSKTTLANLEYTMKQFRQSVSLMRDIIMDAITHQLLRNQQVEAFQTPRSEPQRGKPDKSPKGDVTTFDAVVFRGIADDPQWIPARGIMDTGCDEDWVSMEIIKRAHLENQVARNPDSRIYVGFGGKHIESKHKVKITWYANNSTKTRQTEFLIAEQGPFDLLIGKKFIFSENIFIFNQAALVLRAAPISDLERAQMEANARENNASNEELEAIRQAGEASARNQYREQNAHLLYPDTNSTISKDSSTRSSRSPSHRRR